MKILCIHGVSNEEKDNAFRPRWQAAIGGALLQAGGAGEPEYDYLEYDALFAKAGVDLSEYAEAGLRLLSSGLGSAFGDAFGMRSISDIGSVLRWTAGMVAQWVADDALREQLRTLLAGHVKDSAPDIVCAHSLGSLIAYDTFARAPEVAAGRVLMTFGSQIANPAVRGDVFGGRIVPIAGIGHWYHLYNADDRVFTAQIRLDDGSFSQILTPFELPGDLFNHDAGAYLGHPAAVSDAWRRVLAPATKSRAIGEKVFQASLRGRAVPTGRTPKPMPNRKALLIGINEYPDPAAKLEGCVNDVFRMSATLQESGFSPDDIRVVLDSRATADGIMERLHWLLDDTRDADQRFLFYSGHGAQVPSLNPRGEADRLDECLCPVDFDWTSQRTITDKRFRELYTQLPYGARFVAMFDCCHSGGMTRDGKGRPRGLTPPDDIRHRSLRWDAESQMWLPREWVSKQREVADRAVDKGTVPNAFGMSRLGFATSLRGHDDSKYDAARRAYGHLGPYLPVLLHACRESQLAAEYRHGVTSYGAFTYCLTEMLSAERRRGRNPDFATLMSGVVARLRGLGYEQVPQCVGPKAILSAQVPWSNAPVSTRRRPRKA
jgi:hypothetical protein